MVSVFDKYKRLSPQSKSMLWFSACGVIQIAISSLTTPIFTRLMSTEQYGQFSIYSSWFGILVIFVTLNVNGTVASIGLNDYKDDQDGFIFSSQLLCSLVALVGFCIVLLFINPLARIIRLPKYIILFMILHMSFYPAYDLWSTEKRFYYSYKKVVGVTIIYSLAYVSIGVLTVYLCKEKGIAKILSYGCIQIIIYGFIYLNNLRKGRLTEPIYKYWKFSFKQGTKLIPHTLANQVLSKSDVLMINYFIGASKAGIYSLGYSLAFIISIFSTGISNSLMPWIFQKINNNSAKEIKSYVTKVAVLMLSLGWAMMLLAPEVLMIFSSKPYWEAVYIIPPVVSAVYCLFIYGLFANVELYYKDTSFMAVASPIIAVINIILNAIFIPTFGYIMGAYTTLVSYIIYCIMHYYKSTKLLKKNLNISCIYNNKVLFTLLLLQLCFMTICLILYSLPNYIRYLFIVVLLLIMFVKRKEIKFILKKEN